MAVVATCAVCVARAFACCVATAFAVAVFICATAVCVCPATAVCVCPATAVCVCAIAVAVPRTIAVAVCSSATAVCVCMMGVSPLSIGSTTVKFTFTSLFASFDSGTPPYGSTSNLMVPVTDSQDCVVNGIDTVCVPLTGNAGTSTEPTYHAPKSVMSATAATLIGSLALVPLLRIVAFT